MFACVDFAWQDLGSILVKGYVHYHQHFRLCSLKIWLPMNNADLPELLGITFQDEVILPGRQQHDHWYTVHPTIQKIPAETTTMQFDTSKHLRVDFAGLARKLHVRIMWEQTHGFCKRKFKVCLNAWRNFAYLPRAAPLRQATSLQVASYIAYACSPDSLVTPVSRASCKWRCLFTQSIKKDGWQTLSMWSIW